MLHVAIDGQGPALVLLHGWGLHGGVFAPLLPRLAGQFTVYRVDLPGHGHSAGSPVPATLEGWAAAVLAAVPSTATWLGWSLGGLVAQQAALLAPERVQRLVLAASSPCFARRDDWPPGIDPALLSGFDQHLHDHHADTVDRFLALDLMNLPGGSQAAAGLRDQLLSIGPPAPVAITTGGLLLRQTDLRAQLPALVPPSLWLGGGRDRLVPPAAVEMAAALSPRAQYRLYPRSGHAPFLGDTDAFAEALASFPPRTG